MWIVLAGAGVAGNRFALLKTKLFLNKLQYRRQPHNISFTWRRPPKYGLEPVPIYQQAISYRPRCIEAVVDGPYFPIKKSRVQVSHRPTKLLICSHEIYKFLKGERNPTGYRRPTDREGVDWENKCSVLIFSGRHIEFWMSVYVMFLRGRLPFSVYPLPMRNSIYTTPTTRDVLILWNTCQG